MNNKEFEVIIDKMYKEELEVGRTKGREYAQGDRCDNFKRLGKELGLDPKVVLWVYLRKHLDSISSYIREGKVYSESIESRIMDARVYLSLLRGLIEEEKKEDEVQPMKVVKQPMSCLTCKKSMSDYDNGIICDACNIRYEEITM